MNLQIRKDGIYLNGKKIADLPHKLEEVAMIELNFYLKSGSK